MIRIIDHKVFDDIISMISDIADCCRHDGCGDCPAGNGGDCCIRDALQDVLNDSGAITLICCKDCVYHLESGCCDYFAEGFRTLPDDFCRYGKRRLEL